ncbi:RNA polymerase sigma factor [Sphingobacterium faecale]|nr:RNA polymerase sigma-70 factor [Sphingobacterium faecale]
MTSRDYNLLDDNILFSLLREGDREAFSEIYKRYWMVLYGQVYRMLEEEEETRDIVQEVFTTIWFKRDRFSSFDNLAGLLYTSARHRMLDLLAHRKIQHKHVESLGSYIQQHSDNIIEDLNAKELMAAFELEIEKLPPKMKEIFRLRVHEHKSYQEIADLLGISDLTVKKQVNNAIKIIKPKLRSYVGWISILTWLTH